MFREDVDIAMVGEMRDAETVSLAMIPRQSPRARLYAFDAAPSHSSRMPRITSESANGMT